MSDETKKLKILKPFNDYVAVMREIVMPDGIELPQESLEKLSNEGVVVGVGPDAKDDVEIGDVVVFQRAGRKLTITPESGCYAGKHLVMVRKGDLVLKKERQHEYEFVEAL